MKLEMNDVLFYKNKMEKEHWAVFEVTDIEDTDAGKMYTLTLKLTNTEWVKEETKLEKELAPIFENQEIHILDKDEDIIGQITAYVI